MAPPTKTGRIELRGSECANCCAPFLLKSSSASSQEEEQEDEEDGFKPPNSKISNFIIDVNDEEFTIEVSDALIEIYRLHWVEEVETVETEDLKRKLILCYNCGVVFAQLCKYYYDFNFLRRANALITESQQRIEDMLEKLKEQVQEYRNNKSSDHDQSPAEEESEVEIISERKKGRYKEHTFSSDPALNPILTNLLESPVNPRGSQDKRAKEKDLHLSSSSLQSESESGSFGMKKSGYSMNMNMNMNMMNMMNVNPHLSVNVNPNSVNLFSGGFIQQAPPAETFSGGRIPVQGSNDCIISLEQAEHAILTLPTIIQVDQNFVHSNFPVPPITLPPGVTIGPGGVLTQEPLLGPSVATLNSALQKLDQQVWKEVGVPPSEGAKEGNDRSEMENEALPFNCEECTEAFPTRRSLILHRIHEHSYNNSNSFSSNSYSSSSISSPEAGERCFVCSKVFMSKKSLGIHMSSVHKTCEPLGKYIPEAFPMKCVDCSQMCNNFVELHEHRMRVHPVDEPFQCQICKLILTSASTYQSHMKLHEIQSVDCKFCPEKFPSNSELGRHISACHQFKKVRIERVETGVHGEDGGTNMQPVVRLQPIKNLGKVQLGSELQSKLQAALQSPLQSKLKRQSPKVVVSRSSRYSVSQAKERILFKCVSCPDVFHTTAALGEHRLGLHPDEDTYKCHICGKIVSRANSLNDHVRRHTGLRPYRCKICGNSFKTAGDARQHHFAVHGSNGEKQQQQNKKSTAKTKEHLQLQEDEREKEELEGEDEDENDDRDFVNFPGASLIEVNLSDTGSDSFNMEEVELFD